MRARAPVIAVTFSPDGATLASGGEDGTVRLWNVATGRARGVLFPNADRRSDAESGAGSNANIVGLAFSPRDGTLATASDQAVRLWDVEPRRPLGRPLHGHEGGVRGVVFGAGGTLASGGVDGTLRLWDAGAGEACGAPAHASGPGARGGGER